MKKAAQEKIRIRKLEFLNGKYPFNDWFMSLKNETYRQVIDARLTRIASGNFGHVKSLGKGLFEIKISLGPGLRIYFGNIRRYEIILLGGGNKGTQSYDIEKARKNWNEIKHEIKRL